MKEVCKALGLMKRVRSFWRLGMEAKRELHEGALVPTRLYGAEPWRAKAKGRRKLNVIENNCLRMMSGVTLKNRINNDNVRSSLGIWRNLEDRVDSRGLR